MRDTIVLPQIDYTIKPSTGFLGITPHKVLFVGQKTSDGTATSGSLQENILDRADAEARFGKRAMLSQMIRAARLINNQTQFDAIPLADNGAGVKATGVVTFTGTATAAGTLTFEICSATNNKYEVDVVNGDTAAVIGTKLFNLLNADLIAPFTATDSGTGIVTATAANAGTVGNFFLLRTTGSVAGVTVALTPWAGGATNPVLTTLFTPVDSLRYQTIVWPGVYSLTTVTDFLDPRFNISNLILDGVAIACQTETLSTLKANALAQNSQSLVLIGNKPVAVTGYSGSHMREMNDVVSSSLAAVRSLRLNDDTNLANVVVTRSGDRDLFGGIHMATLPYFNTPYSNLAVPLAGYSWTALETDELEENGVTVIGSNSARNNVLEGQTFTTYVNDPTGNPDTTYHFLNTVDAASVAREYTVNNLRTRYIQSRLTNGDVKNGFSIENANSVRGFMLSIYKQLSDLLVYQSGNDPFRAYDRSLTVEVVLTPGKGTVIINHAPPLVGQLRAIQAVMEVTFNV